jgi:hypothetical protein
MKQADTDIIALLREIRDADGGEAGGGLSSILVGKTLFVDDTNGVDAIGAHGDQSKPYKTLTAAKTAAQSGDTIVVRPGTYAERNLLKNGVNWHFEPGAKVVISTSGAGAAIFDDSAAGANGAIVCTIDGFGEFSRSDSAALQTESVVFVGNASSDVTIRCKSMTGAGTLVAVAWGKAGRLSINCQRLTTTADGGNTVYWENGEMFVTAEEIRNDGATGIYTIYAKATAWTSGSLWIKAIRIAATTPDNLIATLGDVNARVWIEAEKIEATGGGRAINCTGTRLYIRVLKIQSASGRAISAGDEGILWVDAEKIESAYVPIHIGATAVANIRAQTVEGGALTDGLINMEGGTATIEIQEAMTSGTTMNGLNFTSGATLRLLNTKINATSASAGNPINMPGDDSSGLTLQNCTLVAAPGRDSITGEGTRVNIYGGSAANTAPNVAITQQVGTLIVDANVT